MARRNIRIEVYDCGGGHRGLYLNNFPEHVDNAVDMYVDDSTL